MNSCYYLCPLSENHFIWISVTSLHLTENRDTPPLLPSNQKVLLLKCSKQCHRQHTFGYKLIFCFCMVVMSDALYFLITPVQTYPPCLSFTSRVIIQTTKLLSKNILFKSTHGCNASAPCEHGPFTLLKSGILSSMITRKYNRKPWHIAIKPNDVSEKKDNLNTSRNNFVCVCNQLFEKSLFKVLSSTNHPTQLCVLSLYSIDANACTI